LSELLHRPEVREAIFLASPSLESRIAAWRNHPDGNDGRGLEAGLVKYISRMAARCTPFGLFAGSSTGRIGPALRLELRERNAARRHTRLDMEYLSAVVTALANDASLREHLTFSTNTSLAEAGGALRYAEARWLEGNRAYYLVDVEPHEHLRRALARARDGASLDQIARAIEDGDVSYDEAKSFAHQLIDAQLLMCDLGPVVTGPESLDHLLASLSKIPAAQRAYERLVLARDALAQFDREGLGVSPERYRALASSLESLAPVEISRLFQVDLAKPAQTVEISSDLATELLRGAQVLLDLFGGARRDSLETFRRAFEERYGEREISLVEALDEEIGIGFETAHHAGVDPSPLLAGLPFSSGEEEERVLWGSRARFIQWKVAEAIASGAEEIELDPAEIARFHDASRPRLAPAFHLAATILDSDPHEPSAPRAVLDSAAGPSGARLLGRFCHGDDELHQRVMDHLRAEEALRPDVLYFEIVHLPEGRIGNILARPLLRSYELELLGKSGAPRERLLSLDDLTLRLERNRIVLRSRSLDREVRPRLTSAHNTSWKSLGVYRFLSALQAEGAVEGTAWNWGPLESQPRLPRVRLGRILLARQQWNARRAEAQMLRAHEGHRAFRAVQEWRTKRKLPRWVGLVDFDNILPVDLDHPLSVAAFLDEIRGVEGFALQEIFPAARTDAARAPEGRFLNEIIVPCLRHASANESTRAPHAYVRSAAGSHDTFAPGSEWITAKLYGGPAVLDRVLLEVVAPVVEQASAQGWLERWFFVRYADPDWHVRVRFCGDRRRLLADILPRLHECAEPFLADRRIHRLQLDGYRRESIRYGGDRGSVLCEEIFAADSSAVLQFLGQATGDEGLDARWRFCFLGMDALLSDFGFHPARKLECMRLLAQEFGAEFHIDSPMRRRMMDRYRRERRTLEDLLDDRESAAPPAWRALLRERSAQIQAACAELVCLHAEGSLAAEIQDLAASLLHMHANRALRSSPRAQEMVIYHYLENAYASRAARAKALSPTTSP